MTALAAELQAWTASLDLLAPELIVPVADLATHLHGLVGPLRPRATRPLGEPDGFRGLTRRGPYDRLVLSEWALLDAVPDEFVRRAASAEHAFYDLDHRAPAQGLRVRAVFDAGPTQLGAPRLAHLAVLLLLARRAAAAKATFAWSVAQRPERVWDALDRTSVTGLLGARALEPFAMPDLTGEPEADEVWVIGPADAVPGTRRLTLREPLSIDEDVLDVTATDPRGRPTSIRLPLPGRGVRRQLVRDPFAPERPVRAARPPTPERGSRPTPATWTAWSFLYGAPRSVRFLPRTAKLEILYDQGRELHSTTHLPAVTLRHAASLDATTVVATGFHRGNPTTATLDEAHGQLVLQHVPRDRVRFDRRLGAPPRPITGTGALFVDEDAVWVVDGRGNLFVAAPQGDLVGVRGMQVVDVGWRGRGVVFLVDQGGRLACLTPGHAPGSLGLLAGVELEHVTEARFFHRDHQSVGLLTRRDGAWSAELLPGGAPALPHWPGEPTGPRRWRLDVPAGVDLLGLRHPPETAWGWAGWHGATRRVVGPGGTVLLELPRPPLGRPSLSPAGHHLAFRTAGDKEIAPSGTVEVWDLWHRVPCLLRKRTRT